MHELSLCRTIMDIINSHNQEHKITSVKKVVLEIGQLAAIDEQALRFGFEAVTQGTMADGAVLEIILIKGCAFCATCNQIINLERYYDACPGCGQFALTVTLGDELRIKFMEVE